MALGAGLCAVCTRGRRIPGAHQVFWLCRRSATDPRFPRYPRLPVLSCPGYDPVPSSGSKRAKS